MSELDDRRIDELFSQSLAEPEISFSDDNWQAMKQKLVKDKDRKAIFWWTAISTIAATLILAMSWWGLSDYGTKNNGKIAKTSLIRQNKSAGLKPIQDIKQNPVPAKLPPYHVSSIKNAASPNVTIAGNMKRFQPNSQSPQKYIYHDIKENQTLTTSNSKDIPNKPPANVAGAAENSQNAVLATVNKPDRIIDTTDLRPAAKLKFKPSFILSITAAPDLSAVNSFRNNKQGLNGGLLATITLSPKLSISSGAVLAKKIYGTAFSNYKPKTNYKFPTNPVYVDADCRVVDIPLNVNYTFWQKKKASLQLTGGISSYFMISEKYEYKYDKYAKGPYSYSVRNLNKHYFGVGNVAIAYQRTLNSNTALSIQPYLKLPLTEIGYGNVKLLSAGLALNLHMNLSSIIRGNGTH